MKTAMQGAACAHFWGGLANWVKREAYVTTSIFDSDRSISKAQRIRFALPIALVGSLSVGSVARGSSVTHQSPAELTANAKPHYVTSDGSGTHVPSTGSAFGVQHGGVADLIIAREDKTVRCSGALLRDGRSILTAAHCVAPDGPDSNTQSISTNLPGAASTNDVSVHPQWDGTITHGYDVAVVSLPSPVDPSVPRYDIFTGGGMAELNQHTVKVGYGNTGYGETGVVGGTSGTKRAGLNVWEDDGLGDGVNGLGPNVMGITNNDTQLTYDFDSNFGDPSDLSDYLSQNLPHDAFYQYYDMFGDDFTDDEVAAAGGDSGGPSFISVAGDYEIAGVTSYGLTFGGSVDVDTTTSKPNSSWGEFGVDARVAHPAIAGFIQSQVVPIPSAASAGLALLGLLGLGLMGRRYHQSTI
jgi:hypothetical protein